MLFRSTEAIELGYIIRKDKQRQGFAYEGLKAILEYVKEHFDIKSVNVSVHKDNVSFLAYCIFLPVP